MSEYENILSELTAQMTEIESRMSVLADKINPLTSTIVACSNTEQEMWEEFQKQIAVVREERTTAEREKYQIETELQSIKNILAKFQEKHAKTLQQIAAEEKLEQLNKKLVKLVEICESFDFWEKLREFQREDVMYTIAAFEQELSGVLNANDMGLGKTFESAALDAILSQLFYLKHDRLPRVLWLTKKSLVASNAKEIHKWNPERKIVQIAGVASPVQRNMMVDIAVQNNAMIMTNYDALNTTDKLMAYDWDIVFIDEVHKLKGGSACNCRYGHDRKSAKCRATNLWKRAFELCYPLNASRPFLIPLSGSPIQNHPREMWAYLHLFDQERFPSVRYFERDYCYGWGEGIKVDFDTLIKAMKNQVIRRKKTEVLTDLPDLNYEFRYVEHTPEQAAVYQQMRDQFFIELDSESNSVLTATAIIAKLTRLRQLNVWPGGVKMKNADGTETVCPVNSSAKIDEAMEIIEELLNQGEQVVVFSAQFNEPLFEVGRRVREMGKSVDLLTGESSSQTQIMEENFQQGKTDVLCINMKTGGEGMNLQRNPDYWPGGASSIVFLDLWYNPETNNQARDRVWRQGQTHGVMVYVIHAEDSVDQFIAKLLEEKEQMIEGIMEDKQLRKAGEWRELLKDLL